MLAMGYRFSWNLKNIYFLIIWSWKWLLTSNPYIWMRELRVPITNITNYFGCDYKMCYFSFVYKVLPLGILLLEGWYGWTWKNHVCNYVPCHFPNVNCWIDPSLTMVYNVCHVGENIFHYVCRSFSLAFTTKAMAYKGVGQEWSPRVAFHAPKECGRMWGNEPLHSQVSSHFGS
jgi:hypothetical protein